jgi:A/G-specific adenine glycosylase
LETKSKKLKQTLLIWYKKNKRDFVWRKTKNPWEVLLIETLSQQTQIERADLYYKKFLREFPTPELMASSSLKKVLTMWSGLGYNNRAKRLYESSKILADKGFDKIYPNFEILPGVGPYTKNALLAFAYGEKVLAVDTNLERIISRFFGIDSTKEFIKNKSDYFLNRVDSRDLNQAFMDFGSYICKSSNPKCNICPVEDICSKYIVTRNNSTEKFRGSNRELRGKLIKVLLENNKVSKHELYKKINDKEERIEKALNGLQKDNLIILKKNNIIEINSN